MHINIDTYYKVKELSEAGWTLEDACNHNGCCYKGLYGFMKKEGLPAIKKPTVEDKLKPFIETYKKRKITQLELAKKIGCSKISVTKALQKMGIYCTRTDRKDEYQQVVDHLVAHGGYIKKIIRELGFDCQGVAVAKYARSRGIEPKHYQFAHQRYGYWVVQPGEWEYQKPATYLVPAVCTLCGTHYAKRSISNMRSGKTTRCHKCSKGNEGGCVQVRRESDGKVYRSLMTWARELEKMNSYQSIRIKLKNEGEITLDGERYLLIDD